MVASSCEESDSCFARPASFSNLFNFFSPAIDTHRNSIILLLQIFAFATFGRFLPILKYLIKEGLTCLSNFIKFRAFAPSRLRAFAPSRLRAFSGNFTHKTFSGSAMIKQSSFCAHTKVQIASPCFARPAVLTAPALFAGALRWCGKTFQNPLCFRGLFAILAAAFLLAACEPVDSSRGPSKEQAAKQLNTATAKLQTAIEEEVKARKAYVKAATDAGKTPQTAMLRLLRRIVVLGLTFGEAEKKWENAREKVKEQHDEVKKAIDELRSAGGGAQANSVADTIKNAMQAVANLRKAITQVDVKNAGDEAEAFMRDVVVAMSNFLSSGALVYAMGNDYYILGDKEPLPTKEITKVTAKWRPIAGRKDYFFSSKGNKVSLLRRSDGKTIPVENSGFTVKPENLRGVVYRNNRVYYQISSKDGTDSYQSKIYSFPVSASPTAKPLYQERTGSPQFAVDQNGNVLYKYRENSSSTEFLKLRLEDGATIKPSLDGTNPIASGIVVSGTDGKNYLVKKTGSKTLKLYEFATQAQTLKSSSDSNKTHVVTGQKDDKFVRITPKNSVQVSGSGIELSNSSGWERRSIDKAVFIAWEAKNSQGYRLLRLAGGKLDEVALPSGVKLDQYDIEEGPGITAAGSDSIYMRFGNKVYRAGAKGGFTLFFDGSGLTFDGSGLKRIYTITPRTNSRGEFAVPAEDSNGGYWIIEIEPSEDGKKGPVKRRTKVARKVNKFGGLFYLDF